MNKIKLDSFSINGITVKDDERYQVFDNHTLNNLILSQTRLYRDNKTRGHRHSGQEEVYMFVQGNGLMIVGDEDTTPFTVQSGDIVLIPDGAFHQVINNGEMTLIFNCIFQGKRNH